MEECEYGALVECILTGRKPWTAQGLNPRFRGRGGGDKPATTHLIYVVYVIRILLYVTEMEVGYIKKSKLCGTSSWQNGGRAKEMSLSRSNFDMSTLKDTS
jgi:hypothetical protein